MKTIQLSHQYRPLKIAYAIQSHDSEQLLDAIQRATTAVGGKYNPIIPIGLSSELQTDLLSRFRPDVVENLAKIELPNLFNKPYYSWDEFGRQGTYHFQGTDLVMDVLDVGHILRQLADGRQFRTKKATRAILPKWDANDQRALMYAASMGMYFDKADFGPAFTQILPGRTIAIKDIKSASEALAAYTPIDLTSQDLTLLRHHPGSGGGGFYMGNPSHTIDIINFWNLRASGKEIIFVDISSAEGVPLAQSVAKTLADVRGYKGAFLNIWYRSDLGILEEEIQQFAAELTGNPHFYRIENSVWTGSEHDTVPELRIDNTQYILGQLEPYDDRQIITFSKPPLPYKISSQRFRIPQLLVSNISYTSGLYRTRSDIMLPAWNELTQWASWSLAPIHDLSFRLKNREIEFFTETDQSVVQITPVRDEDLIHEMFRICGMDISASAPGTLSEKLITRMGGLESCRVLKIRGVRSLIENTAISNSVQYTTARDTIKDRAADGTLGFDKFKQLHIEPRDTAYLKVDDCIDFMIKKSILKAGYELKCHNCTLPFWVSLEAASDYVKCEYCFEMNNMAVQIRSRGDIRYRRSGLFGRDNHLEGGVPVILSLMQLNHMGMSMECKYSTSQKIISKALDIDCETDLIVLGGNDGSRPSVLIGECKTNKSISWDDATNLMQVARILRERGLSPYVLMAKLGQVTKDEIKIFKHMRSDGFSPLIFTREELEPYDLREAYRGRIPDNMRPNDFRSIGEISAHLYLSK